MSSTLINTLKMNLYSFLGLLTLLLFFANANAYNCGKVYGADEYPDEKSACNCTNGEVVACDDLSGLTPTNNDDIGLYFYNLTIFDGSFLANSAVTTLGLFGNNLTTENITNLPSSVTFLGIINDQLTKFDGSFLANSAVTTLYLESNKLVPETITNLPSSVTILNIANHNLLTFDGSFLANSAVTFLSLASNNLVPENITNFPSSVRELNLHIDGLNGFNGSFLANSNVQNVYLSGNKTDILKQNITNMPPNITIKFGPLPIPEIPTPTPTPTSSEKLSTALIIVIAISSFIFVAGGLYALYLKCNGKGWELLDPKA